jgi:hypothetical protein
MSLTKIQTSQLRKYAAAHGNDANHPDANAFAMVKASKVTALTNAGYLLINTTLAPNAEGEQPARVTQAGIDFLASTAVKDAPAEKPVFTLVSGVALPASKRGNLGGTRASLYPFAEMQPGQSFFVPATEGEKASDVAKRLASSVSTENKANIVDSRPLLKDGVQIIKHGKPAMEHKYGKHYSVRPLLDGKDFGQPGVQGAGVWMDVIPA